MLCHVMLQHNKITCQVLTKVSKIIIDISLKKNKFDTYTHTILKISLFLSRLTL